MDDASDAADRRSESRAPIELKVEYKRLNAFFADYTKNISRGGTFIKTTKPLPIGTEFLFKLYVPHLPEPLQIHGEVQWIVSEAEATEAARPDDVEAGMGIRFVYRDGDPRAEIMRTVERLMVDSLGQRIYTRLMDPARGGAADVPTAGGDVVGAPGADDGDGGDDAGPTPGEAPRGRAGVVGGTDEPER